MLFDEVRALIAEVLTINADDIKMNTRLIEDLNADSLDAVELSVAFESKYGAVLPDDELIRLETTRDIVAYIEKGRAGAASLPVVEERS